MRGHSDLLIPRGLDLLPSVRAPRNLTAVLQHQQHQHQDATPTSSKKSKCSSAKIASNSNSDDDNAGGVSSAKGGVGGTETRKEEIETDYVPWIGGGIGAKSVVEAETGRVLASGIGERVQWFPRGLPVEVAPAGAGQVGSGVGRCALYVLVRFWGVGGKGGGA